MPDSNQTFDKLQQQNRYMKKQKRNVNETSKSAASKRRKRHSTSSDDKLQFLTTASNVSLETDVILKRQGAL